MMGDSSTKSGVTIGYDSCRPETEREKLTSDPPSLPIMHITAADSGLADMNTNIPWILEWRDWAIFKRDILDSAENKRAVCVLDC